MYAPVAIGRSWRYFTELFGVNAERVSVRGKLLFHKAFKIG
jgi:hypothetical protein